MEVALRWPDDAVETLAEAVAQRLMSKLPRLALQQEIAPDELVTIEWVAKQLGVTPKTIRLWCDEGRFPPPMSRRKGQRWRWRYAVIAAYLRGTDKEETKWTQ